MDSNVTEVKISPRMLKFVMFLLLAACAWPLWMLYHMTNLEQKITQKQDDLHAAVNITEKGLAEQIAMLETGLVAQSSELNRISSLENQLSDIKTTMLKQQDDLYAAISGALPVNMPVEWEERFQRLNDWLMELELPLGDDQERKDFTNDVSELVSELSPFAETQYLPRLAPLRWAVVALDAYHHSPDKIDDYFQFAEDMHIIADAAPADYLAELAEQLRDKANELEVKAEYRFIKCTIQQTKEYLGVAESQDVDKICRDSLPETPDDPQVIYENLSVFEDDSIYSTEIKKLQKSLMYYFARKETQDLEERWKMVNESEDKDSPFYEMEIRILLQEVEAVGAAFVLHDIDIDTYDDLVLQLRDEADWVEEKIRLDYQKWAWGKINAFQSVINKISQKANDTTVEKGEKIVDKVGKTFTKLVPDSWMDNSQETDMQQDSVIDKIPDAVVPDTWTPELLQRLQIAMIEHLLPIDQAKLNRPILLQYQREFDRAWSKLEGTDEQKCVAIASTFIEKKNLINYVNDDGWVLTDAIISAMEEENCKV